MLAIETVNVWQSKQKFTSTLYYWYFCTTPNNIVSTVQTTNIYHTLLAGIIWEKSWTFCLHFWAVYYSLSGSGPLPILEKYNTPGQPDRGNGINALLCPPTVLSHTHTVFIYFLYVSYVISHVTGIIRFWYVTCMVLSQSAIAMVMGWWQSIDRIWMNEWVVARSEDRSCSGDQTLRHWSELCTSADSTTSLHTRHPQIICNQVP